MKERLKDREYWLCLMGVIGYYIFGISNILNQNNATYALEQIHSYDNSIFADKSTIDILNVNNKKTGGGEVSGVIKAVESSGKTIAVVLADRIDFFDVSGKYLNSLSISGKYKALKLFASGEYAAIDMSDSIKVVRVR